MKLIKDSIVKEIENPRTIKRLKNDGWTAMDEANKEQGGHQRGGSDETATVERDSLFSRAKELGLNPHHATGVEKLKVMITEAEKSS